MRRAGLRETKALDEKKKTDEDHQRVLMVLRDVELKNRELTGER